VAQALPVYAFWYGRAAPAGSDDSPPLADPAAVQEFMLLAGSQEARLQWPVITTLADRLYEMDGGGPVAPHAGDPARPRVIISESAHRTPPLRRAIRKLTNLPGRFDAGLQEFIRHPSFLHGRKPIQPADVNRYLERALLDEEKMLEDVDYSKIVPNDFVVEVNAENYERNYRPIVRQVIGQWQDRLLETLNTANGRMGRREYKFGGPVRVDVQPNPQLAPGQVQIQSRINPQTRQAAAAAAADAPCLEWGGSNRRWPLGDGVTTIGRSRRADIHLDLPAIQESRLVSGLHAYLVIEQGRFRLFDGSTDGAPSTNGTYVNGRRLSAAGQELRDGDQIILAALQADRPRPDTPGVAVLTFWMDCPPA
jgi:hypothetical protein